MEEPSPPNALTSAVVPSGERISEDPKLSFIAPPLLLRVAVGEGVGLDDQALSEETLKRSAAPVLLLTPLAPMSAAVPSAERATEYPKSSAVVRPLVRVATGVGLDDQTFPKAAWKT